MLVLYVFPTTLLTEQRGRMKCVMVCEFGNETIALCAFAGAIGGSYHVPGWVPPIGKFSEEWEETQNLVSKISNQMNAIQQQSSEHVMIENENEREPSIETEWNRFREDRARISSKSLARVWKIMVFQNARRWKKYTWRPWQKGDSCDSQMTTIPGRRKRATLGDEGDFDACPVSSPKECRWE
jgi:hypothetical protein